ncbi:MAG: flavodoxin family protein [Betaproteobacteria bacterium]
MNAAVVYFSQTGNTKRLAQAIADNIGAPLIDLALTSPSSLEKYGLLVSGTRVEGASPAKETLVFIEGMNHNDGAKAIVFCTWKLFGNGRTMKAMEKALSSKGYTTILCVSKKGMKPEKEADFCEVIADIKKPLQSCS